MNGFLVSINREGVVIRSLLKTNYRKVVLGQIETLKTKKEKRA